MKGFSWLISKYILGAVLPYFIFSWLLLSVVLFVQQVSRFSDIFFNLNVPNNLIWQLALAIVPNVIAFTCPMAVLIGVIIGLSKLQGDSELTAIRAAGVGNFQLTLPIVLLGIVLSNFAFFINLEGVPFAARVVRGIALRSALYKLESPIEPGVFNTEINGFTIYVKDGDLENGIWKDIFIHQDDQKNKQVRLITSKKGKIDANDTTSELVLEDAFVNTITNNNQKKLITENLGEIRLAIKTKRNEIAEKISQAETTPEELGLNELAEFAKTKEGRERTEAEVLWQRRILLSVTPLIFALLGAGLVLRYNRSGRGFGIFLALVSLVAYYLISLLGEQLARTNFISVFGAALLPLGTSSAVIFWLFLSDRFFLRSSSGGWARNLKLKWPIELNKMSRRSYYIDHTSGILDFDIVLNLLKYFILTLTFLTSIYLIFTVFELWKFAGTIPNGVFLLAKYLFFLLPFIYIQLAPSAVMITVLATYVIKSRRNEIVTWTASGQSIYRLLIPCFILMGVLGLINWEIQERIAPGTNQIQDSLRTIIRNRGVLNQKSGKFWVSNGQRIYSFEASDESLNNLTKVKNLVIYQFSENSKRLGIVYKSPEAIWREGVILFEGGGEKTVYGGGETQTVSLENGELETPKNPFTRLLEKPSHLNANDTKEQIENRDSELEKRNFEVALQKKYTTLVLPFVIALFTAPFALSLNRKGKVGTIGYAVGLWLLFLGITNAFEQMGLNGLISPVIAVWCPVLFFAAFGILLLTRVKT
ncbi:MAG: LptF/LptG family permease [Pyrinomonadaceae bacterium]